MLASIHMDNEDSRPFVILVGVDYSELGDRAFQQAVSTARGHEHAYVHVVHVLPGPAFGPQLGMAAPPDLTQESERLRAHVEQLLARCLEREPIGRIPPFDGLTTHIGIYGAAETIGQLANALEADLVVVGTHGRKGVTRMVLGSVAERTVRLAPCPVLVVRPIGAPARPVAPKIEPACPRCLEMRHETNGRQFWCDQHAEHHDRRHTYHFDSNRPSHQSGLLIPYHA
jgi:nucleotide-binding universal stress UspA family protein